MADRGAPQSVVEAVQETNGCRASFTSGACTRHPDCAWTPRGCRLSAGAADAAFAASLRAAAERIEQVSLTWAHPHVEQILRRWADESEGTK